MPLLVLTARISTTDPDRFDITRAGVEADEAAGRPAIGAPFAPPRAILDPAKREQRHADELAARGAELLASPLFTSAADRAEAARLTAAAEAVRAAAWATYAPLYRAAMQRSYREHADAWRALLARPRSVLVCYCPDRARCHRGLLAGYLVAAGAEDGGEVKAT